MIVLLFGAGVQHFVRPQAFTGMIPRALGHRQQIVLLSGAAELIGAGLLSAPATRKLGGTWAAVLFAAVFPANISMALRSSSRPLWFQLLAWGRLPLQLPLIRMAWRARTELQS